MTSDGKDATIIFPHIPKTGGTTVFYHFRTQLDGDSVQVIGPFNGTRRFIEGKRQFEELDDYTHVKVVQGHGVDENCLIHIPENRSKLFVLLRHPVAHTRSRFTQLSKARARRKAKPPSAQALPGKSNLMCHRLVTSFPSFIKNHHAPLHQQA
ncbi:MAG: hypothetical protein AAFX07_15170, partial [Pseudomonadota bacterium]